MLGGTAGQATRMVALELAPTRLVGLVAGGTIAAWRPRRAGSDRRGAVQRGSAS